MNNFFVKKFPSLFINSFFKITTLQFMLSKEDYIRENISLFDYNKFDTYNNCEILNENSFLLYLKLKFIRKYFTIKELIDLKIISIQDLNNTLFRNKKYCFVSFLLTLINYIDDIKDLIIEILDIDGLDINFINDDKKTILMNAIPKKNIDILEKILTKNPDVTFRTEGECIRKDTLYIWLFHMGNDISQENLHKIIIEQNDINRIHSQNDISYMCPLYFASLNFCTFYIFELIIKNGANINFKKSGIFKDFKDLKDSQNYSILGDLIDALCSVIIRNNEKEFELFPKMVELYLKKINLLIDYGVIIDMSVYFILSKYFSEKMKIFLLQNTKLDPNIFLYIDLSYRYF